jgi:ParB family chromosome partitioning protein
MRRALGRGLSELLGDQSGGELQEVPISSISPNPNQPRKEFDPDSIAELAESIKKVGVMQPIVVREKASGSYEIIAGERRWRAAEIAGLSAIPVVIKQSNDVDTLQMALIENIQREGVSVLELAGAYRLFLDTAAITQEDLANRLGKSRVSIANALRLLKLPEEIRSALRSGKISEGHGRALLQFGTDAERLVVFERILGKRLSVREVERLAKTGVAVRKDPAPTPEPDSLSTSLSERLGSPSRIIRKSKGGRIEIEFFDDDDLSRILDDLGVSG